MTFTAQGVLATSKFTKDVDNTPVQLLDGTPVLFGLEIDNSQNSVDVFVKFWDLAIGAPTPPSVGTSVPDIVIRVTAGTVLPLPMPSDGDGIAFALGMWIACVTAGGTGGSTSPPNTVTATIWAT